MFGVNKRPYNYRQLGFLKPYLEGPHNSTYQLL